MKKTLVLYLYREDSYTKSNLMFFIKHGVFSSPDLHFIFLINDFICSVDIPQHENITIIKKENSFDLGSYWQGLNAITISEFCYFIFINSSCIGPYLPIYARNIRWYQHFISLLNERVKLVAPIAEFPPDELGLQALDELKNIDDTDKNIPFLHTYMFATDSCGLEILKKYKAFPENETIEQKMLIEKHERLITSSILNEGYEIKSLLYRFVKVNISDKSNWNYKKWSKKKTTCPEIPGNYEGIDVSPLELIFVKNIRRSHSFRAKRNSGISKVLAKYVQRYSEWMRT